MGTLWEVRGLFGNEYALENAMEEIKKFKGVECSVLDRRNLQVVLTRNDEELKSLIKNAIEIAHGFVEGDAPLGKLDKERAKAKAKRLQQLDEKRKKLQKAAAGR